VREDPAVEISTELALDEARITVPFTPPVGEERLEVLADDRMQDGGLGLATAVGAGERGRCGPPETVRTSSAGGEMFGGSRGAPRSQSPIESCASSRLTWKQDAIREGEPLTHRGVLSNETITQAAMDVFFSKNVLSATWSPSCKSD
jgi:hypothetical protein